MDPGNTQSTAAATLRKELLVSADRKAAFEAFTVEFGRWWPLTTHHIGAKPAEAAIIEPFVNGRWFEVALDGTECDWGRVLVWEPPSRLMLSWNISSAWQFDATLLTEVDVRFESVTSECTRIVLEHRHLDRYGPDAQKMYSIFDSEGGWTGILKRFEAHLRERPLGSVRCPDA